MNNKPKVRFQQYQENWKSIKLGNAGTTFTGLSGKTKSDFGHGSGKYVTYMNVFSNPIAKLEEVDKIEIDKKQNEIQKGDIFFTTSSETPEEVGMSSVWTYEKENYYLNSFCFGYRPKIDINEKYIAYLLRAKTFRKNIKFLAQGISRYNISKTKAMDIEFSYPDSFEQEDIGNMFVELDRLILEKEVKNNQLLIFKKSMQNKMFVKSENDVPKIRFSKNNAQYKKYILGENSIITTGGTPSTNIKRYWDSNDIPWLSSGEVHKKRINNTDQMISKEGYENSSAKWVKENSILIALAGQGKTRGTVAINEIPLTTNQSIAGITLNSELDTEYVYQNLESRYNEIRELSAGDGGRGGLNKSMIYSIEIYAPEKTEQVEIGKFFKNIDLLIENNRVEIEKLNNIKKSLMNRMFL